MQHSLGLVLSGGGVRGAAHAGVLKVFEERGVEVGSISGTSAGAVAGALWAAGHTADEILEVGESWEFYITNFSGLGPPVFASVGKFSGSSAVGFDTVSNASILARQVPEPSSLMLLGLAGALLLRKRPTAARAASRQAGVE